MAPPADGASSSYLGNGRMAYIRATAIAGANSVISILAINAD